jgi:DNA-binding response OmpR family regulator
LNNIYKILIIEDDINMTEIVKKILERWGFSAYICENFDDILKLFVEIDPHILLLDINIPAFDGFYWCKKIREISSVPIVFVSSRDSSMDIIMAVNSGGDDYIQKPFDSNVLAAKLQAIIRRTYEYSKYDNQVMECNNLIIDMNSMNVYYGNESSMLTKNEFRILKTLIENQGKVVSRENLMKQLWNEDIYVNENALTVNINRLRKKLENMGAKDFINTKKGIGYVVI